ncbi:OSJNBa0024J22.14-like protein [Zea mays]|uniref:OSJNBa0024J22.14-like protein n=1 Tax=Zea mays TaxID=4577 RepID=A0A1D6MXK0_MAIZE|nr:OSJNBa0024J22.14-like protein [Zea mays]
MSPFGAVITPETLKYMSKYQGREITQVDCAREAMRLIHAEDKNLQAENSAWELKKKFGNGVSTMVLVYNATGATLSLADDGQDWTGSVYSSPISDTFHNGQWIAFLHVKPAALALGSQAARVFRGRDVDGRTRDFVVACENYFKTRWSSVKTSLGHARRVTRAKDENCASTVSIGGYTTAFCIAVLQHQFQPLPEERE